MNKKGFTAIEIIVVAIFLIVTGIFVVIQKSQLEVRFYDATKKQALNSIHYALEYFHSQNGYYPRKISGDNLKTVDPNVFTDPQGVNLGEEGSEYIYTPADCEGDKCQQYTLKTEITNEADFIKKNK